jgi:hypothetical protein
MAAPSLSAPRAPSTAFAAASQSLNDGSPVHARAVVWSAVKDEFSPETRQCARGDALMTVVTRDLALLHALRIVSGSYVVIGCKTKQHVARLELVRSERAAPEGDVATVVVSPLLAFNLGLPLHAAKGQTRVAAKVRTADYEYGLKGSEC